MIETWQVRAYGWYLKPGDLTPLPGCGSGPRTEVWARSRLRSQGDEEELRGGRKTRGMWCSGNQVKRGIREEGAIIGLVRSAAALGPGSENSEDSCWIQPGY